MFFFSLCTPLIALFAYVAISSAAPADRAAPSLSVKTSTSNANIDGLKNLKVTVTVINTGGEAIKLLNDPRGVLDPFPEDSFTITDPSGSRLSFIGARASYNSTYAAGAHDPTAFTVLGPGDSINVTHDLSPAYEFSYSGVGDYSIEPSNFFAYVDGDGTPKDLCATVEGIAKLRLSGDLAVSPHIHDKRQGSFLGCEKRERAVLRARRDSAHTAIVNAYGYTRLIPWDLTTARLFTWFGDYSHRRRLVVEHTLWRMSARDQFTRLNYHCFISCLERETIAFVLRDSTRDIYICPPFFDRETKADFQVHTLIHEISHYYGSEDHPDIEYGEYAARELAARDPELAIHQAENYAFYVQNKPYLP